MVRTVQLSTSVSIPQLGYGAMGLSQGYGKADDDTSRETLRHAIKIGYNLWNTATVYGPDQHNEKLLGSVLREGDNRSKVIVTTKWGVKWDNGDLVTDGSPEFARQCIDQSIENLGSAPDMWLLHRIDKKVPVEESVKAMEEARQAGKCKYIGLSAMSANTLRRAAKVAKIDFVEMEFSPFETGIEDSGVIDACKELGVKIFAYSPLGHGFLTGRFRSFEDVLKDGDMRGSGAFPRFNKEVWDHNFKLVEALEKIAEKKGCKASQLALAWAMQVHGNLIIPIPGTKSIKYLEENFAANDVVLSQAEMDEIRKVIKENPIKGAQYGEKFQALMDE
ncbi:Aldo/keto reductase [Rhodotorula toruloides ATCC 204091]|nr:Aldo/keto reductase [Rhodotorula toruloides ATCC 204091]